MGENCNFTTKIGDTLGGQREHHILRVKIILRVKGYFT